jgi:hypothetical protein
MSQNRLVIIGFIFFVLGFLSIILSLVGLKLDLIGFLYKIGPGFAFLVHLILMFGGVALIYVGKNKDRMLRENEEEVVS